MAPIGTDDEEEELAGAEVSPVALAVSGEGAVGEGERLTGEGEGVGEGASGTGSGLAGVDEGEFSGPGSLPGTSRPLTRYAWEPALPKVRSYW